MNSTGSRPSARTASSKNLGCRWSNDANDGIGIGIGVVKISDAASCDEKSLWKNVKFDAGIKASLRSIFCC